MGLIDMFKPKWKSSNPNVRLETIKTLDQETLLDMFAFEEDCYVRTEIVKHIEDQKTLLKLFQDENFDDVKTEIMKHIDQKALAKIAFNDLGSRGLEAVKKIHDQGELVKIGIQCEGDIRKAALDKVTSDQALLEIVNKASSAWCRFEALKRLNDAELIRKVAVDDSQYQNVRIKACSLLPSSLFLKAIFKIKNHIVQVQVVLVINRFLPLGPIRNDFIEFTKSL